MKKILLLPLMMGVFAFPGFGEPKQEIKPQNEIILTPPEPKLMEEVLSHYHGGQYDGFLKQMDRSYEEANEKWKHKDILEERKKLSLIVQDFNSPKADEYKRKLAVYQEQENRELIDLCLSESRCDLTQDVKKMIFFTPSQHQQESLDYVNSLSWKFKGDGKTPIENKLIEIDIEFWLKSLSLDLLLIQNKVDERTYTKQRAVLQFEKLKQMKLATKKDEIDPKIQGYIETVEKIYPKVQECSLTRKYVQDLMVGRVKPQTPTEEKIKAIAVKYQEKQEKLTKEYFPEEQK